MLGNEIRELSDIELLNRDYYQGRFASKINRKQFLIGMKKNKLLITYYFIYEYLFTL